MIKKYLFLLIALIAIVTAASATVNIVSNVTPTTITWQWVTGLNVSTLSVDGYNVFQFDHNSPTFILSGLDPNTSHTILIYTQSPSDSGTNTATTKPSTSSQEKLYGDIDLWIYVIIVILCFLVGRSIHWIFYFMGSAIALYALYSYIEANPVIVTDIVHIQFWIYIALFLMGMYLWLKKMRGKS